MISRNCRFLVSAGVLVVFVGLTPFAGAQLPSTKDVATSEFQRALNYERMGSPALAIASYKTIFRMEDEDHEFGDIRGLAGIRLVSLLLERNKGAEALEWLERVANMKDAPKEITSAAKARIDELRRAVERKKP